MKLYLIVTKGMCKRGIATILAESKDHARQVFIESLHDESDMYENDILSIKEISMNVAQVIYYDDGDR